MIFSAATRLSRSPKSAETLSRRALPDGCPPSRRGWAPIGFRITLQGNSVCGHFADTALPPGEPVTQARVMPRNDQRLRFTLNGGAVPGALFAEVGVDRWTGCRFFPTRRGGACIADRASTSRTGTGCVVGADLSAGVGCRIPSRRCCRDRGEIEPGDLVVLPPDVNEFQAAAGGIGNQLRWIKSAAGLGAAAVVITCPSYLLVKPRRGWFL